MRAVRLMLLLGLLAGSAIGGCGMFKTELDKCREQREYQEAAPGARVQVPADLQDLNEDAWVPVPYGESNTEATPPDDPCLIQPPDYRDESRS